MIKFTYKARDKSGKSVIGQVEAPSLSSAAKLVRERGNVIVSLKSSSAGIGFLKGKLRNKVSSGDIASFTRQLSTMIGAGLPITDSLSILKAQSKASMQEVVGSILADVEGGKTLSVAMGKHKKAFPPAYLALIKAGETGGVLDKILLRLADNLERSQEFRGKVKGAMVYPIVIVIGMIVVASVMMIFVMPRLTTLYDSFDADLPTITVVLVTISNAFVKFWPLFLAFFGAIFWGFKLYKKTPAGRMQISKLILKIPVYGDLHRTIVLTELTSTLSLMVGAGVPILDGLEVTVGVVDDAMISDALADVTRQIEKGFPISYSFAKHPEAFPFILSQMISVGEETGKMDEVLGNISHVFEVESEQQVKMLSSLIEPIVMVVLGLGVAFLVIAIILPIYTLTTAIG